MAWTLYRIISTFVNLVMAVITFFLGLRIILRLFNANQGTPFVQWIYGVSDTFIAPFSGIFPNPAIANNAVFDMPAFIALVAYALLFFFVLSLINMATGPKDDYLVTDRTHRHVV